MTASVSFSILAHLLSLSDMEVYTTSFQWALLCYSNTVPILEFYDDASANTLVGASELYSVNIVGLDNSEFTSELTFFIILVHL